MLLGKHFIAYAFIQQWFKIGGDGQDTNQMSGTFNFTYLLQMGGPWAPLTAAVGRLESTRRSVLALSIGPQLGKMCKRVRTPTLFQLQVQYHPVRPEVSGPKWNIQLQATLTIPALIKRTLFAGNVHAASAGA